MRPRKSRKAANEYRALPATIAPVNSVFMSMYQLVVVGCLTLCCYSLTQAQSKPKPNLAGVWIVDSAKSEKTNNPLEDAEKSVTIQQNEPEIRITHRLDSFSFLAVYFSDQRGETFKSPAGGPGIQSKTKWDGDKLVIHYVGGGIMGFAVRNVNVVEEWKLSKDGQSLTKKIIVIPPRNAPDRVNAVPVTESNQEYKKVYNRAPA
jgi:hypothetical protein